MRFLAIGFMLFSALLGYACCKVSGDCSREEEEKYG